MRKFGVVAIWVSFLLGLTMVFGWLLELQRNPNQSNITSITNTGAVEVMLQRNRQGHYLAFGEINGQPVEFFLDTGATDVSIPLQVASRLGLQKGQTMLARTANGTVKVYATRLDLVSLGGISMANVSASINPGMTGEEILLGMSFLKNLEMIQRGNTMTLRTP